ncbi:DUF4810 domain-containing protein [Marinobacter sp. NP-4(2019)]|uniref:DUF4810 domain-containing protein n=1 Tax=Marinobacter sp. NP-4(2019) TaxID=2488665 RepID=UPI000FC3F435|nr:DUF4810 domain-containing protein [Marinobacter sp. NP-4(2019)]AZT84870.1 DUF4810 domain-containing protein [Marinobacter sp. NP-4(2019)]
MTKRFLLALSMFVLLAGCASNQGLYEWGQYQETLFVVYQEPALKEEALKNYMEFVETGGTPEHPIAPGLFAEAGTFMLEQGDVDSAIKFYKLEYDAWPESRPMLSMLIKNLEARQ